MAEISGDGSASTVALVGFADGVDHDQTIARLDAAFPYGVIDESLPAPPGSVGRVAQISRLPLALAAFVAMLAVIALFHGLMLLIRRRRGDLATLRALDFTPAQVAGSIASAGTVTALLGVAVGMPLGLVATVLLSSSVIAHIDVVPGVWLPVRATLIGVLIVVVIANAAAALPATAAARIRSCSGLRTE
jgi:lipoprotein-releasing system permease protein